METRGAPEHTVHRGHPTSRSNSASRLPTVLPAFSRTLVSTNLKHFFSKVIFQQVVIGPQITCHVNNRKTIKNTAVTNTEIYQNVYR